MLVLGLILKQALKFPAPRLRHRFLVFLVVRPYKVISIKYINQNKGVRYMLKITFFLGNMLP